MPPPQRIPSLPGATHASKKAFKPPARVTSSGSSTSAAPPTDNSISRPASTKTMPAKSNRANSNQANTTARNEAGPSRSSSKPIAVSRNASVSGFTKASVIEDVDMFSDIDDDEDDDLELEILDHVSTKRPTTLPTTKSSAPATGPPPTISKRRNLADQLPALSQSPDPPARARDLSDNDDTIEVPDEPRSAAVDIGAETDEIPLLPAPLLTRLLHESFEDKGMKIGRDANALVARYMDIFVREAVARAEEAHLERARRGGLGAGDEDMDGGGVFLDTKDLEDVALGLVLDF